MRYFNCWVLLAGPITDQPASWASRLRLTHALPNLRSHDPFPWYRRRRLKPRLESRRFTRKLCRTDPCQDCNHTRPLCFFLLVLIWSGPRRCIISLSRFGSYGVAQTSSWRGRASDSSTHLHLAFAKYEWDFSSHISSMLNYNLKSTLFTLASISQAHTQWPARTGQGPGEQQCPVAG